MEEERVVYKPEKANGDEGTKIGEVLRAIDLQSCYQATAKLLLHDGRVWNIVLAKREEK